MTDSWADQLDLLIRARTPILWIRSLEEERVDGLLEQAAQRLGGRTLLRWDFIDGLSGAPNRSGEDGRSGPERGGDNAGDASASRGQARARERDGRENRGWLGRLD